MLTAEMIVDFENRRLFDLSREEHWYYRRFEPSQKHLLDSRFVAIGLCPFTPERSLPPAGFCRPWIVLCNCLRTNSLVHRVGWKLKMQRVDDRDKRWKVSPYLKQFITWLLSSSDWRQSAGSELGTEGFIRLFGSRETISSNDRSE